LNIAIVCPNFPPANFEGGISHYSARLAESLLCRGHKVCAFISTEFAKSDDNLKETNGVELIRISGPWNYFSISKIKKAAKEKKIDALILQYAPALFKTSFRIKWAMTRFPCQQITAFHTLWGKGFDRLLGLLILWGSFKIISTNSEIMTILGKRLPQFLKKTSWIPIASAIEPIHQKENKAGCSTPIISYFGMLYPGKGLYLILDILQELQKRGHRFEFKFIGGGILFHRTYEAEFRNEIKKRKLNGMVEALGMLPAEEVSKWLNKSRFVLLPYDTGLSDRRSSFITALVHGKAILTSPPIVHMPSFENGFNVLWPDEHTVPKYIQLMEQMLKNDELINRLEKEAEKLSRIFCWEKISEKYEIAISKNNSKLFNLPQNLY
jgi:glycosyltransferase involved in cell wall biosynthesis